MTSGYDDVRRLLMHFDRIQDTLNEKKKTVNLFIDSLKMKMSSTPFAGSNFLHVGTISEETAVDLETNFDIAMILPSYYSMKYFQVQQLDEPGIYVLPRNADIIEEPMRKYVSDHLEVEMLRRDIFGQVERCCRSLNFYDYKVYESRFKVKLPWIPGTTIKCFIIPMMEATCLQIPDFSLRWVPDPMVPFVKSYPNSALTLLGPPPDIVDSHKANKHRIVQFSFDLLDRELINSNCLYRDSIRLAKYLAKTCNLYSLGLTSNHIKRVAMSVYKRLIGPGDTWCGCKTIVRSLNRTVKVGYFGYITLQPVIIKTPENRAKLLAEIKSLKYYKVKKLKTMEA